eukprot:scaffold60451_cov37-Prasinocladus_malaysianus.AAC.1
MSCTLGSGGGIAPSLLRLAGRPHPSREGLGSQQRHRRHQGKGQAQRVRRGKGRSAATQGRSRCCQQCQGGKEGEEAKVYVYVCMCWRPEYPPAANMSATKWQAAGSLL